MLDFRPANGDLKLRFIFQDVTLNDAVPQPIGARESVYLDLVRSLAAFVVVLDHAPEVFAMPGSPRWGHQAVMVFFVLSGYVICNTADTRERSLRVFLVARFARLWSVLLPALLLTVVCDVVGRTFGTYPAAYQLVPANLPVVRIGATALFLSETWVSIQPLSNGVVWSLCAEFWYYMLFAAWVFLPRGRMRVIGVTVAALLAGHKALLLLPIWLMGVLLQRSAPLRRLGIAANLGLWAGSLIVIFWVLAPRAYDGPTGLMQQVVGPWLFRQLDQARVFWLDWVFGLVVAAHLLGARVVAGRVPMERIARPVRWCAGISFAAYLFHMPLLTLSAAFLPPDDGWIGIVFSLVVIAVLGPPVERSKRYWRRSLDRIAAGLFALLQRSGNAGNEQGKRFQPKMNADDAGY